MVFTTFFLPFLLAVGMSGLTPSSALKHPNPYEMHKRDQAQAVPTDLETAFTSATWIWTPDTTAANAAFRKTFATPVNKTVSSADIIVTVDNSFTLYVNGAPIGQPPNVTDGVTNGWQAAQKYSVALNSSINSVFAILGVNFPDPAGGLSAAGLLAAVQVNFTDGTNTIFTSDNSWKALPSIPVDFQNPQFDDSSWGPAVSLAKYGTGPWLSSVTIPPASPSPLTLTGSTWIWSSPTASTDAPPGPCAFRKNYPTPSGKSAQNATILLSVDDGFTLYLNGAPIGNSPNFLDIWMSAQRFTVPLVSDSNLFAVRAVNLPDRNVGGPSAAGLIAAIQIFYSDGTSDIIHSDTTWRVNTNVPDGFELPSTDDGTWPLASGLGPLGMLPWQNVSIEDSLALTSAGGPTISPSPTSTSPATVTSGTSPTHVSTTGGSSPLRMDSVLILLAATFSFVLL